MVNRLKNSKVFKFLAPISHFRWRLMNVVLPVCLAKWRYIRSLARIQKEVCNRKVRVGFVVTSSSKWKAQSLYDLMLKSERYEPYIVPTIADIAASYAEADKMRHYLKLREYFVARGAHVLDGWDKDSKVDIDLAALGLDVVFYHNPWYLSRVQEPSWVAKSSLTAYIPYYVPNYGDVEFDCDSPFHRTLHTFFTLNSDWQQAYEKFIGKSHCAAKFVPAGHTALDCFLGSKEQDEDSPQYVIYAPHWSIDCAGNENAENYSTFLWTGREILKYAQEHREFNWVFKPHPTLKHVLVKSGAWTLQEVEDYDRAWEEIGTSCMDGDYQKLFLNSRAMITDCGSFLVEYPPTEKPLIHLISPTCKIKPISFVEKLFGSFYQVHSIEELHTTLSQVLTDDKDLKRDERLAAAKEAGILNNYAAGNILVYFNKLLGLK